MENRKRNSNIEMVRIVSMMLILFFHGGRTVSAIESESWFVRIFIKGTTVWGCLGVWLFVIVGAWFLVDKEFDFKKVISLLIQTYTWILMYLLIYLIYNCVYMNFGIIETIKPVIMSIIKNIKIPEHYWFIRTYIFMLLISPFLNMLFESFEKRQIEKLLFVFSFILIFAQYENSAITDIFSFSYAYVLVGYLKKFVSEDITRKMGRKTLCFVVFLIISIVKICFHIWNSNFIVVEFWGAITGRHSIILLVFALSIFFNVVYKKPTCNRLVNNIASCTLGVYLFHEFNAMWAINPMNEVIKRLIEMDIIDSSIYLPIQYTISILCIFTVGIFLEFTRNTIIQKPLMKYVSKKHGNIIEKINNWFNQL